MARPRYTVEKSRERLDANEWLYPGEVAILAGVGRWSVIYWIKKGRIYTEPSPGGHRQCKPDDVRAFLREPRAKP